MSEIGVKSEPASRMTKLLILAFIGVFAWQTSLYVRFGETAGQEFVMRYSFIRSSFLKGEYYRLFTSIFLHGGIMHLLSNSVVFFIAGKPLEQKIGSFKFAVLFFLSAFSGSLLMATLLNLSGPALGASGGVMGVLAAASLLVPTDSTLEQIPVLRIFSLPALRLLFSVSVLGVFFVFQESLMAVFQVYSMVDSTVGHVAHLGGILAGIVVSYFWYPEKVFDSARYYVVFIVLLGLLVLFPPLTREWVALLLITIIFLLFWSRQNRRI